ncbi:MAG: pyrroloquinoline quinone biosynthesis peptide chaperone PqqD [Acetobacter syzygii]
MTQATGQTVTESTVPRFARGTRLQYDRVREVWFVQAPERAFHADPIAAEILQLVDGSRTLGAIIDQLAHKFDAPRSVIAQDVLAMVADLTDKQVLLHA